MHEEKKISKKVNIIKKYEMMKIDSKIATNVKAEIIHIMSDFVYMR